MWAVLALLCFLRATYEGLTFFTKCPDPRLLDMRDEPLCERSVLFRLSAGLVALIRSVGVAGILEGTEFDAEYAEQLLTLAVGFDCTGRTDFVCYSWNQRRTLPMPSDMDDEAGAVDGNAALGVAEADDAYAMPADDGAAQPREVAADTEVGAALAAVPARGGATRVGSIQSDSPKGVAQE